MADSSSAAAKAAILSESDRDAFYAWASQQGFTRVNTRNTEILGEMWIDRQGKIWSAARLVTNHPDWRRSAPRVVAAPRWTPVESLSDSLRGIQWLRLLPTVIIVMLAIAALQLAMNSRRAEAEANATPPTVITQITPAPAIPVDESRLGLTVTTRSNMLEIRWNRKSATIAAADRAEMKITEKGITESVPFDHAELRDGYVAYGPKTTDVDIRLQVFGKDGAVTSESVRAIAIP